MKALSTVLEAFARGALDDAVACFAPDGIYREPRANPIRGRAEIAAHFARFTASGIVWRFDVDDIMRDTDRACVVYRYAVPGGEGESWRERAGCATVRFGEGGLIAEWREYEG